VFFVYNFRLARAHFEEMTVRELKEKLKLAPDGSEVLFDDLQGGRLPVADVRLEPPSKFDKPGQHTLPALVVVPKTGLDD
jgi:hypothetical protein